MYYALYDLLFIEFRLRQFSLGSDVFFAFYVSCFMLYDLCIMLSMICSLSNLDLGSFCSVLMSSLLFMFHALCFMTYVLCSL